MGGMVADSAWVLAKGLTIAVRYSCVRRQFENTVKPGEEMQIIEYQTQKKRLVTMLASCYATFFTSQELDARYEQLQRDLKNNDLSALNVVHATSAGLKAFCTWYTNSGLEVCRQGLGGHGYSKYSGFPSELANWAVQCTWEGDNSVLALQTARFLIGCAKKAQAGEKMVGSAQYLNKNPASNTWTTRVSRQSDWREVAHQLDALAFVAAYKVRRAHVLVEKRQMDKGVKEDVAKNETAVELLAAAKAHID